MEAVTQLERLQKAFLKKWEGMKEQVKKRGESILGQWNGMCKVYTGLSLYPYNKEKQARVSVVKAGG